MSVVSLALLIFCIECYDKSEKSIDTKDAAAEISTDDFYAYYTRLDYEIPVEEALDYIPMEYEEEEEEYEDMELRLTD